MYSIVYQRHSKGLNPKQNIIRSVSRFFCKYINAYGCIRTNAPLEMSHALFFYHISVRRDVKKKTLHKAFSLKQKREREHTIDTILSKLTLSV